MRILRLAVHGLGACAAIAVLVGCGGGSQLAPPTAPFGTPLELAASRGIGTAVAGDRSRSWMSPDAKKGDLLYVSDLSAGDVDVYSYPRGKLKGTLTGFEAPQGECVDKAGDVFVVDAAAHDIYEYAHGGTTPIATLSDPGWYPLDCSVDPTTGKLAVTNESLGSSAGSVSIYKHAKHGPRTYTAPNIYFYYNLGYDDAGNLYVDGNTNHINVFQFAELPAGTTTFSAVDLDQTFQIPGSVQWDGKYVAVGNRPAGSGSSTIYQFTISGSTGTEVGSTPLGGSGDVQRFWIEGSKVVGTLGTEVLFWTYPAGGTATKTLDGFTEAVGVTVSKAK